MVLSWLVISMVNIGVLRVVVIVFFIFLRLMLSVSIGVIGVVSILLRRK